MSDVVLNLINKYSLAFTVSGQDYLIKCLNPEHPDSNPSMRVDKQSGLFNCFACGFKGNLFKFYGEFTNRTPQKVSKLKEKIENLRTQMHGLELPKGSTPYTRAFRGVSASTLKHFEAFYTHQEEKLEDRICFPIKDITGKTQVFVARHTMSNGNPRYVNYPRGVTMPLFPPAPPKGSKSIVLVEGIFDMLNLYDKGVYNAICTFGTNTLQSDTKLKLQPFKAMGVVKVFIMFDGDEAGERAAEVLKPIIEECDFEVEIIKMPEGTDPGELGKEDVLSIAEYVSQTV